MLHLINLLLQHLTSSSKPTTTFSSRSSSGFSSTIPSTSTSSFKPSGFSSSPSKSTSTSVIWYLTSTVSCTACHEPCSIDKYSCYGDNCVSGTVTVSTTPYGTQSRVDYPASCYTGGLTFPTGTPALAPTASLKYDWSFESESCYTPCGPCQTETYFCESDLCSLSYAPKTITQASPYIPSTTFTSGSQCTPGFITPPARTTGTEPYPYTYHLFYDYDCTLPCGPCSNVTVQCSNTQCSYDDTTFYGTPGGDDTLVTPTSCPKTTQVSSTTHSSTTHLSATYSSENSTSSTSTTAFQWGFETTLGCNECREPCSVNQYKCYGTICTYGTSTITTTQNLGTSTTQAPYYASSCFTGGLTFPTGSPNAEPTQSLKYDWTFESESCYTPCGPCQTDTYFCEGDSCSLTYIPKTITQTSPYIPSTTFTSGSQCTPGFITPPARTTSTEKYPYTYHLFYDYDCTLPCGPCSTATVQCSNTQCSYDGTTFYGTPAGDNTFVAPTSCPKTTSKPTTSSQAKASASS
ncbi:unnamed protein product [Ambrosiozyma monospora]|uniref:Unnamed protein product n=1 Tax=Ambrosiozyma monospora TaxID=43982 RepID=A0ACB5TPB9_AMBMO|nr:unnamed protein product [Ambrosiozyma monospora]